VKVAVKELPLYHALWTRFRRWMHAHGLVEARCLRMGVGHDDSRITAPEKCRYDACAVVPEDFGTDRWVNVMDLPGGKYAVAAYTGTARQIQDAWDALYRSWLPESGYQPDDRPCLELYRGNPEAGGSPGAFCSDLCVPIRPL
jgi:AraC family transcriptional regulator